MQSSLMIMVNVLCMGDLRSPEFVLLVLFREIFDIRIFLMFLQTM